MQGLVSLGSARKSRMGRKEGGIGAGGCALAGIGGLGWGSSRASKMHGRMSAQNCLESAQNFNF